MEKKILAGKVFSIRKKDLTGTNIYEYLRYRAIGFDPLYHPYANYLVQKDGLNISYFYEKENFETAPEKCKEWTVAGFAD